MTEERERGLRDMARMIRAIEISSLERANIALNARAILPDGNQLSRAEILEQLNLNPNTPPEAWLNIVACGSNAAALNLQDAKTLNEQGTLSDVQLAEIAELQR